MNFNPAPYQSWLKSKRYSASTIRNYLADVNKFLRFVEKQQNGPQSLSDLSFLTPQLLSKYLTQLTDKTNYKRYLAGLNKFCQFALDQKIISTNPIKKITNSKSINYKQAAVTNSNYIIDQFANYLKNKLKSVSTIKNYIVDVKQFLDWNSNLDITSKFEKDNLKKFQTYLADQKLSRSSIKRKLSSIALFKKFLEVTGYIKKQPVTLIPLLPKATNPLLSFLGKYLPLAAILITLAGLTYGLYYQAILKARYELAYSTSVDPTRPTRQLSFQGRLTDSFGNPVTSPVGIEFKLYTADVGGSLLYDTGVGDTIVGDDNGIFSALIGGTHGSEIPLSVFTENPAVWLEITMDPGGSPEIMDPRQQIATVAYAMNADTLQGLPPGTTAATANTILVLNNDGNLLIAETSPSIISQAGTFGIEGQAMLIKATDGSGGNVTINPDGNGIVNIVTEGTSPTVGGFVNITNANLVSGNLINAQIENDNRGYNFISLSNYDVGTTNLSQRFSIDAYGDTYISSVLSVGAGSTLSGNVDIGGTLTLSQGASDGFILQTDASGHTRWISPAGVGTSFGATNGLSIYSTNIGLGGTLNQNTNINLDSYDLSFLGAGGTQSLYLSSTGNVGIGTTSPQTKLQIRYPWSLGKQENVALYINDQTLQQGGSNIGGKSWIIAGTSTTNILTNPQEAGIAFINLGNNFYETGIAFHTSTGGNRLLERMRITNSGSIGIGITSPSYTLHVGGTGSLGVGGSVTFTGLDTGTTGTGSTAVFVDSAGNLYRNTLGALAFQDSTAGTTYTFSNGLQVLSGTNIGLGGTLTQNTQIGTSSFSLSFLGLGNTQSLFIRNNGYIGIGTTSPGSMLQVGDWNNGGAHVNFPGTGNSNTLQIGAGSSASGGYSTAIGYNAVATGIDAVSLGTGASSSIWGTAIGTNALATSHYATSLGYASNSNWYGIALGPLSYAPNHSIAIGIGASANSGIAIGNFSKTTASNQLVIGGEDAYNYINNAYFGRGVASSSPPTNVTLQVTGGSGTNISGSNLILAGGRSTGSVNGGDIIFQTSVGGASGTTLRSLTEKLRITSTGLVGIGISNPSYTLHVGGTGSLGVGGTVNFSGLGIGTTGTGTTAVFIDASGNLYKSVLGDLAFQDNASLGWIANATSAQTIGTGTTLHFTGVNGLTSTSVGTSQITFGLGGTLTQNTNLNLSSYNLSFLGAGNTQSLFLASSGYVGIGTTNPTYKFQIDGTGNLFSIKNSSGTDLFSVTDSLITSNLPHNFTSAGDVSMAYDLLFTNPTSSTIKASAPFYLETYHPTSNIDMYLSAANAGQVIIDDSAQVTTNLSVGGTLTLPQGASSGYLLQSDASGNTSWISPAGVGTSFGATNGLSIYSTNIGLGGTLTQNTSINLSSYNLSFLGAGNTQSLYLASSGNVGIGTTGLGATFSIKNNGGNLLTLQGNNASSRSMYILDSNGNYRFCNSLSGCQLEISEANVSNFLQRLTAVGFIPTKDSFNHQAITVTDTPYVSGSVALVSLGNSISNGNTIANGGTYLGINRPATGAGSAADLVNIQVSGQTSFLINSSGNVGIATTSPNYTLEVGGTGSLGVGGNSTLSGNVNIGGTLTLPQGASSGYLLQSDASGNTSWISPAGVGTSFGATNGLSIYSTNIGLGGTLTQNTQIGTSSFSLSFLGLGNTQGLYLLSTGNVSIGTTGSSATLQVAMKPFTTGLLVSGGSVSGNPNLIQASDFVVSGEGKVSMGDGCNAVGGTQNCLATLEVFNSAVRPSILLHSGSANLLQWQASNPGIITNTGLVGIGLTNPSYTLHVGGTGSLGVGGSVTFTGLGLGTTGTGTTAVFIDSSGNLYRNVLGAGAFSDGIGTTYSVTNGLSTISTNVFGLGGTLNSNTFINTGTNNLYFMGVNNNTQALTITSSGQVGVGTTSPNARLTVYPVTLEGVDAKFGNPLDHVITVENGNIYDKYNDSGNKRWEIASQWVDDDTAAHETISGMFSGDSTSGTIVGTNLTNGNIFHIYTSNGADWTKRLTILQGGNVGIATTSPSYTLHVGGTGTFGVGGDSTLSGNVGIGGTLTLSSSTVVGTGTTALFIDPSTNVVTRRALGDLAFQDSADLGWVANASTPQTIGIGTTLHFTGVNGLTSSSVGSSQITFGLGGTLNSDTNINLSSYNLSFLGAGNTQGLYLASSGYVGIGTTAPNKKLHIYDNLNNVSGFRVQNISNGTSAQIQNVLENDANYLAYYGITGTGYNAYPLINGGKAFFGSYLTDTVIFTQTAKDIIFGTNGTAVAIIKSGGNFGIGTTSPLHKLHVAGDALISTRLGIGATSGSYGLFVNSSGIGVTGDSSLSGNVTIGGTLTLSSSTVVGTGTTALFIDPSTNVVTRRALGTMAFDSGTYDNYQYWQLQTNGAGTTNVDSQALVNFVNGVGISIDQTGSTITLHNVGAGTTYTAGIGLSLTPSNVFNVNLGIGLTADASNNLRVRYNSTLTSSGDDLSLNLNNANTWTALQTFTTGIGVTGNSTFTNNLTIGGTFVSVGSTNTVTNLSADYLDGRDSTYFVGVGQTGNFITTLTPGIGITITGTGVGRTIAVNYDSTFTQSSNIIGLNLGTTNVWLARQLYTGGIGVTGNSYFTSAVGITGNLAVGGTVNFANLGLGTTGTGTTAVFIDASGNLYRNILGALAFQDVGGTYTATNGLNLTGSAFGLGGTLTQNTNINLSSYYLSFLGAGNTQGLYLASTGNVGIGTSAVSSYKLIVNDSSNTYSALIGSNNGSSFEGDHTQAYLNDEAGAGAAAVFYYDGGTDYYAYIGTDYAAGQFAKASSNLSARLATGNYAAIFENGNVGIDNTAPVYNLHIGGTGSLGVGGTVNFSGIGIGTTGTGTTAVFISSSGNLYRNVLGALAFQDSTPGTTTYTFLNGLTTIGGGNTIGLGGTLSQNTFINTGTNNLYFMGVNNNTQTLAIKPSGYVGIGTTNPSTSLDIRGTLHSGTYFSSTSGAKLAEITNTTTDTSQNVYNLLSELTIYPGTDTTRNYYNAYFNAQTQYNSYNYTGRLVGLQGQVNHFGTGTVSEARGYAGLVANQSTGTITNSFAGYFGNYNLSTGLISNAHALLVISGSNSGSIINKAGLTIENISGGTNTTNILIGTTSVPTGTFNIYSTSTSNSYLAGRLGIATSSPAYNLQIGGTGSLGVGGTVNFSGLGLGTTGAGTSAVFVDASGNLYKNVLGALAFQDSTAGTTYTFLNGLTSIGGGNTIGLGGTLAQNTNINLSSYSLSFLGAGDSQSLHLASSGYVGIGTTSPTYKLDVVGSGNILNVGNIAGTSLFSVTDSQITSNLPHAFTSTGDVSMAYDLYFTNQTASKIESYGPLSITAGESYESNNLTLRTYNSGQVYVDSKQLSVGGTLVLSSSTVVGTGTTALFIDPSTNVVTRRALGNLAFSNVGVTATNGLTNISGNNIGLGSSLTQNTTIGTSSYFLRFMGLGGSQALFISPTGNVSVGTTAIGNLTGTGNIAANAFYDITDSSFRFYVDPGQSSSTALNLSLTHNAAIGFNATYDVGDTRWEYITGSYAASKIQHYANGLLLGVGAAGSAGSQISGWDSGLFINASGNVGIGTTNPSTLLHLDFLTGASNYTHSTVTGSLFLESNPNSGEENFGTGIIFGNVAGAGSGNLQLGSAIYNIQSNSDSDSSALGFAVHGSTNADPRFEAMRIDYNGYVGIGTTSPSYKLHVVGDGYVSTVLNIGQTLNLGSTNVFTTTYQNNYQKNHYVNITNTAVGVSSNAWQKIASWQYPSCTTYRTKNLEITARNSNDDNFMGHSKIQVFTYTYPTGGIVDIHKNSSYTSTSYDPNYKIIHTSGVYGSASPCQYELWTRWDTYWQAGSILEAVETGMAGYEITWYTNEAYTMTEPTGLHEDTATTSDLYISSSGFIGVNTESPTQALEVNGLLEFTDSKYIGYAGGLFYDAPSSTGLGLRADNLYLGGNNDGYVDMTINTSGYVGIGTTSPSAKLSIGNNVATGALDNFNEYQILLYDTTTATTSYGFGIRDGTLVSNFDQQFHFDRQGSTIMTIGSSASNNGNIGIGTTNPVSKLNIHDTSAASYSFLGLTNSRINHGMTSLYPTNQAGDISIRPTGGLSITGIGSTSPTGLGGIYITGIAGNTNPDNTAMVNIRGMKKDGSFYTGLSSTNIILAVGSHSGDVFNIRGDGKTRIGNGSQPYQMLDVLGNAYISGNLGIGITSPTAKLHVRGASGDTTSNADIFLQAENSVMTIDDGTDSRLGLVKKYGYFPVISAGSTTPLMLGHWSTANLIGNIQSGTFSEKMRINPNGNVGIGITGPISRLSVSRIGESYALSSSSYFTWFVKGTQMNITSENNSTNTGALIDFNAYNSSGYATNIFLGAVAGPTTNGPANFVVGRRTGTTSWAESMRINTSGYLGLGTTNPQAMLDISDIGTSSNTALFIRGPNAPGNVNSYKDITYSFLSAGSSRIRAYRDWRWGTHLQFLTNSNSAGSDSPQVRMHISENGYVGIGTTSPTHTLDIDGHLRVRSIGSSAYSTVVNRDANGALTTSTSDIRLKKDVTTITNALDKVMQLRGVTYNWKDPNSPNRMTGMIAQEVLTVMPELVFQNPDDGFYGLFYGETSGLLIEAIKEQQNQIINLSDVISVSDIGQLQVDYNVSQEVLEALGYSEYKNEIETAQYELKDTLNQPVTRLGQFAKLAVAKIESGLVSTKNLIADNIAVGNAYMRSAKAEKLDTAIISPISELTDTIVVDGKLNINDSLTAKDIGTTSLTTQDLTAKEATISTLYAENIISKEGSFSQVMTDKVTALRDEIRTLIENSLDSPIDDEDLLAQTEIGQDSLAWDLQIDGDHAQISGNLSISNDLVVSGQLSVLNNFTTGMIGIRDNLIETASADLYIQPSQIGTIHLLGDTMVIADTGNVIINANVNIAGNLEVSNSIIADTIAAADASISGTLTADTVKADTFQVATSSATPIIAEGGFGELATSSAQLQTNATAGTSNLPVSKTELIIYNPKLTSDSMVYLTPQGSTNNQVVYVKNKYIDETDPSLSYFTIALDQPLDTNLDINWWIIN